MITYSDPPVLLHDVIADLEDVVRLLQAEAPYAPLGGWYSSGVAAHARTRPMWFRGDWVFDDHAVAGADLFLRHAGYVEAAKRYYDVEVVEPTSVYVNVMAAVAEGGPAHTDNPRFHGRDRTNTPMWLLRTMLWSGLFDGHEIVQATAIWWMHDVEGGGLLYWPDGPDCPPREYVGAMANTALLGDNHGMFHQVGPVGPFDQGTRRITPSAALAPAEDGTDDWAVTDAGELRYCAPLERYRVSVLWKADVYTTEAERARRCADALSMDDVADVFNDDLAHQPGDFRFDVEQLDDPSVAATLAERYPEAVPVGALPSVFDVAFRG